MDPVLARRSFGLLLALTPSPEPRVQEVKLNGPLQKTSNADSFEGRVSPDGNWLVYEFQPVGPRQIHSVPLDGSSAPIVLSLPEYATASPFEVTSDSQRVVYRVSDPTGWALVSSPLEGGTLPTLLKLAEMVLDFRLSPDGSRAVVLAEVTPGVRELFSVPVDRSSNPVRLNPLLVAGGDVAAASDSNPRQYGFAISPDGQWVAYRADQEVDGVLELYGVPIDGSQAARKLSGTVPSPGQVARHVPLAFGTGNRVVFLSFAYPVQELYTAPVDGSQPAVRIGPLQYVSSFSVSPSGDDLLFTGDEQAGSELYRAPIGGGTTSSLSGPLVPGGTVLAHDPDFIEIGERQNYVVDPVSSLVVYLADQLVEGVVELFSVPLDGSRAPLRLNQPLSSAGDVQRFLLSPGTGRAVYWTLDLPTTAIDSVAIEGGAAPVRIRAGWSASNNDFAVTPDGLCVVFGDQEPPFHIHGAPIDGSMAPWRLTQEFIEERYVYSGSMSLSAGQVVYAADADYPGAYEIYTVPVDGSSAPTRRSADLPLFTSGDVSRFDLDQDGRQVAFLAHQEDSLGIHLVPTNSRLAPRRIAAGGVSELEFEPSLGRVLYLRDEGGDRNLYSVALDGSPPLMLTTQPMPAGSFQVVPGGTHALYRVTHGGLWSVPTDGSTSAVILSTSGQSVSLFETDPQGSTVLFNEDSNLYSRVVDGSQPAVLLGGALGASAGGFVELGPDGSRVLFASSPVGLSSAPVSGAAPTVALQVRGSVSFPSLSLDSTRAFYVDDFDVQSRQELFTLPVDGSGAPLGLGPGMPPAGDVTFLTLDPDRTHAYYLADQDQDEVFELYRVPTAGGPSIKLSGTLTPGGDVSPGVVFAGTRLIYRADQEADEVVELYSVPTDGSGAPTRLNPPLVSGGDVLGSVLDPTGEFVVFMADAELDEEFCLYLVPSDGNATARRLHRRPVAGGDAYFLVQFQAHPPRIVFLGDMDEDETVELYSSPLRYRIRER